MIQGRRRPMRGVFWLPEETLGRTLECLQRYRRSEPYRRTSGDGGSRWSELIPFYVVRLDASKQESLCHNRIRRLQVVGLTQFHLRRSGYERVIYIRYRRCCQGGQVGYSVVQSEQNVVVSDIHSALDFSSQPSVHVKRARIPGAFVPGNLKAAHTQFPECVFENSASGLGSVPLSPIGPSECVPNFRKEWCVSPNPPKDDFGDSP